MIVLDASVVVELLTNGLAAEAIRKDLANCDESFIAPYLLDVEVLSALRGLAMARKISSEVSGRLLDELELFPIERYSHLPVARRVWELRSQFTAYDATYIALAEQTGGTLYTCDEKLVRGHRARVVLFRQLDVN